LAFVKSPNVSFDDLFMYPSLASNGSLTLHLTLLGGGGSQVVFYDVFGSQIGYYQYAD
jgi:hypothetical protein